MATRVALAVLTVTALLAWPAPAGLQATGAAGASPAEPFRASLSTDTGVPAPCLPHPPIEVTEHVGPKGFVLGHAPATGDPIYRPGSGVTDGRGTAEDPYVIEDWCIEAPAQTFAAHVPGLEVENTSVHVVVRDNVIVGDSAPKLSGSSQGVVLDGVANVELADNAVLRNGEGVRLTQTTDVEVEGNEFAHTAGHLDGRQSGLHLVSSSSILVANNTFARNSHEGIVLEDSDDNRIANNTFSENGDGIRLEASSRNVLVDNEMGDSEDDGILLEQFSTANTIEKNTLAGNGAAGLRVEYGDRNRVANNTVTGNVQVGVVVEDTSEANAIQNNTVEANGAGILMESHEPNEATNNTVRWNGVGVVLNGTMDSRVADNRIAHNERGVVLEPSHWGRSPWNNTIRANDIAGNVDAGLLAHHVTDLVIDARDNWWGDASGPSGEVEDACTDAVADGDGDAIEPGEADVCFDPWLEEPNPEAGAG